MAKWIIMFVCTALAITADVAVAAPQKIGSIRIDCHVEGVRNLQRGDYLKLCSGNRSVAIPAGKKLCKITKKVHSEANKASSEASLSGGANPKVKASATVCPGFPPDAYDSWIDMTWKVWVIPAGDHDAGCNSDTSERHNLTPSGCSILLPPRHPTPDPPRLPPRPRPPIPVPLPF